MKVARNNPHPWPPPLPFTTSQLVPSLSRVNKFDSTWRRRVYFRDFLIFFPLNSQEKGFEFFAELYIFDFGQTHCEIQDRLKQHFAFVVTCCT